MQLEGLLFQNWAGMFRTVLVGMLAYVGLVLFLRISGKRTLAKLNAFDLVVTVALGSTLSAILLQESVALAEGLVTFATLIGLQYAVTFLSVRWRGFSDAVRSDPTLLARDGEVLERVARRERITSGDRKRGSSQRRTRPGRPANGGAGKRRNPQRLAEVAQVGPWQG